jgi:LysR family glycine cleavage system transcriptional activator
MKHRPTPRDPGMLRSLQYFEAVARLGSVSRAAAEIGVSASAVSHQLRDLSASLGEELIVRNGRGIALSPAGARLATRLTATFSDIDAIIAETVGAPRHVLRLGVCSSFGPAWMAPRMPAFLRAHPEVDLELRLYAQDPEQTQANADAFVTAQPVKPGFEAVLLFDEVLVSVRKRATPAVRPGRPVRLITTDIEPGRAGSDWTDYAAQTDTWREDFGTDDMIRSTHYLLALELAKAGVGLALVPDFLAAEALANGSLELVHRARVPSGRRYHLCFKTAHATDPAIRTLSRWIRTQTTEGDAASGRGKIALVVPTVT